jgi:hypothetical protein
MKKQIILPVIMWILICVGLFFLGFKQGQNSKFTPAAIIKLPQWGQWGTPVKSEYSTVPGYIQFRQDTNSGAAEMRVVEVSE